MRKTGKKESFACSRIHTAGRVQEERNKPRCARRRIFFICYFIPLKNGGLFM